MKGTVGVLFALTSSVWRDLDDCSCAGVVPTFQCGTNKQQRFKKKTKKKVNGSPSQKNLMRRATKKVRQRNIANARDSLERKERLYQPSNSVYVKQHGRLELIEDRFSDSRYDKLQWDDNVPMHGPHKEGVLTRDMYEISMWYRSLTKKWFSVNTPSVKRVHRVYYGSEMVLLVAGGNRRHVSWADDNKEKLVKVRHFRPNKPYNCFLAHRDCFMRQQCYCMVDNPDTKPIMGKYRIKRW